MTGRSVRGLSQICHLGREAYRLGGRYCFRGGFWYNGCRSQETQFLGNGPKIMDTMCSALPACGKSMESAVSLYLLSGGTSLCQKEKSMVILPIPKKMEERNGQQLLQKENMIVMDASCPRGADVYARLLQEEIRTWAGMSLGRGRGTFRRGDILLKVDESLDQDHYSLFCAGAVWRPWGTLSRLCARWYARAEDCCLGFPWTMSRIFKTGAFSLTLPEDGFCHLRV